MAILADLPKELLLEILNHLASDEFRASLLSVLRVCKSLNSLALSVLLRHVKISDAAFVHLNCNASPRLKPFLRETVRHLEIHLTGYERYTSHEHRLHLSQCLPYSDFTLWQAALTTRLQLLSRCLPQLCVLQSFRFSARSGWVRMGQNLSLPYLDQDTFCKLLEAISRCRVLEALEIDTEDVETSNWSLLNNGLGPSCKAHVCSFIARTIASLPRLSLFKLRRQDLCHEALRFDTYMSHKRTYQNDGSTDKISLLPNLREFVIDLRLPSTQVVERGVYEAATKPCVCTCTCQSCTQRQIDVPQNHIEVYGPDYQQFPASSTSESDESKSCGTASTCSAWIALTAPRNSRTHQDISVTMDAQSHQAWDTGSAATKLRNQILNTVSTVIVPALAPNPEGKDIKVLSNGNPQSEMMNWTRRPTIWDFVRRTVEYGDARGLAMERS